MSAAVAGFRGLNRRTGVDETDETLVAQLRAGDDAAFEAIYDRYARGVFAFCVHMLGNREAAEDALQLTFVSAFRALRRSDGDVSLRPWLYTIARNRCLSELRTRRGLEDDDALTDRPSPERVPDQVQRREDLRELLDDMRRLPADQRAALVLFELADHSHEEIAAVLGVRREKVKALVFQAREALARGRRAREHPCAEVRERLAT
ncbi:MAG: sigma-70 family RNA polymerase sigma factor, partial [Solirubrobacterales bacterium]|nr:sigma-70 family RNA polymerase sigma factor [Solirubrobacterales bacterium]